MQCRSENEDSQQIGPRQNENGEQKEVGAKDKVELVEWKPWSAGLYVKSAFEEGFDEVAGDCAESEKCGVEWEGDFCVVEEGVIGEDSPVCEV